MELLQSQARKETELSEIPAVRDGKGWWDMGHRLLNMGNWPKPNSCEYELIESNYQHSISFEKFLRIFFLVLTLTRLDQEQEREPSLTILFIKRIAELRIPPTTVSSRQLCKINWIPFITTNFCLYNFNLCWTMN